jgi:hypothetical protein
MCRRNLLLTLEHFFEFFSPVAAGSPSVKIARIKIIPIKIVPASVSNTKWCLGASMPGDGHSSRYSADWMGRPPRVASQNVDGEHYLK